MHAIEMCVQKKFFEHKHKKKSDHLELLFILYIVDDDYILFHWPIFAVNWDNKKADALPPMIAGQWVTFENFLLHLPGWKRLSTRRRNLLRKAKDHTSNV